MSFWSYFVESVQSVLEAASTGQTQASRFTEKDGRSLGDNEGYSEGTVDGTKDGLKLGAVIILRRINLGSAQRNVSNKNLEENLKNAKREMKKTEEVKYFDDCFQIRVAYAYAYAYALNSL